MGYSFIHHIHMYVHMDLKTLHFYPCETNHLLLRYYFLAKELSQLQSLLSERNLRLSPSFHDVHPIHPIIPFFLLLLERSVSEYHQLYHAPSLHVSESLKKKYKWQPRYSITWNRLSRCRRCCHNFYLLRNREYIIQCSIETEPWFLREWNR